MTASTLCLSMNDTFVTVTPLFSKTFFGSRFQQVSKEVAFAEGWFNGTGYLDHAVTADLGQPGDIVKSVTPQGRPIIIVVTRFGNIVMFKRYSNDDSSVVVSNMPEAVEKLMFGSDVGTSLGNMTLEMLIGNPEYASIAPNMGMKIEELFKASN